MDDVTPAAATVAVPATAGSVEYASWGRRAAGWTIDWVILSIGQAFLAATGVLAPFALLLFPVYYTVAHGRRRGRTIGNAAVGIAVRDGRTFGPIGYRRAFGRWLATALFCLPFLVATAVVVFLFFVAWWDESAVDDLETVLVLWAVSPLPGVLDALSPLWNGRNQAWHDRLAGTIVVRV